MRDQVHQIQGRWSMRMALLVAIGALVSSPASATASKVSWLDDILQQVVVDSRAATRADSATTRAVGTAGRLFARQADDGLEALARRSDDFARASRSIDRPAEAVLDARFARLVRSEPKAARVFAGLAPAEKRMVVEMGESAGRLARKFPDQAETMIRRMGPDGLLAVRAFGDDVAEVIAKEGPSSVNVLRKTGRAGWAFFTGTVLPHKKKLAAAGVLAAFLAAPDQFIDTAGRVTEYAVREFARAGVQLAGAVAHGTVQGTEAAIGGFLADRGRNSAILRSLGMGLAAIVAVGAALVAVGFPVAWMIRPWVRVVRWFRGGRAAARTVSHSG